MGGSEKPGYDEEDPATATISGDVLRFNETVAQSARSGPRPIVAPSLSSGEIIASRYRVEDMLGRGGFGEVYRVVDQQLGDAPRALKLHRLGQTSGEALDSLKAEFALLRTLSHPNLAKVHDFGYVDQAVSFFTQDLAAGQRMDRSGLQFESDDMLEVLAQLCRALSYLHGRGILHGDIKPSNVLVDGEGKLVLLDFGIARAFGAGDGTFYGTYAYTAPEVISGRSVDARADLYSFGVLLYQLASGRLPFEGSGPQILRSHIFDEPPPLSRYIAEPIRRVIERMLAKSPGARPGSAALALEELSAAYGREVALDTEETLVSQLHPTRLVGLDDHVEHLLGRCLKGRTTPPIVLRGPTGTGKSTALREVQHRVQLEGGTWIGLRVHRDEGELFLSRLARAVITPSVAKQLSDDDRRELAREYPWLRHSRERLALALDPERAQQARIAALVRALEIRFTRAGALVIDDFQRLDAQSAEWLEQLIVALPPGLIQVIVAGRGKEVRQLGSSLNAEAITVEPLSVDAAWELVEELLGSRHSLKESALAKVIEAKKVTGSYLETALRRAVEQGKLRRVGTGWVGDVKAAPIKRLLEERVLDLSSGPAAMALDLAVLGRPVPVDEVSRIRKADVAAVAADLHGLDRAGMLESRFEAGRRVYAIDERYGAQALRVADREVLRESHLRIGRFLKKSAKNSPERLARAAAHHRSARKMAAARELFIRAAREAESDGLPQLALRLWSEAELKSPDLAQLIWWHDLADKSMDTDVRTQALAALEQGRDKATKAERAAIDARRARDLIRQGEIDKARQLTHAAIGQATEAGLDHDVARLQLLAGDVEWTAGAVGDAYERYRAAARAGEASAERAIQAQGERGASLTAQLQGDLDVALVSAEAAAKLSSRLRDGELTSDVQRQLGNTLRAKGKLKQAAAAYRRAIQSARRVGSLTLEAKALNNLGTVDLWHGNPLAAEEAFRRSVKLKERAGDRQTALNGYVNIGTLLLGTGRPAEAEELLGRVLEAVGAGASVYAIAVHNYGDTQIAQGNLDEAVTAYMDAVDRSREAGYVVQEALSLTGLARACLMRNKRGDKVRASRAVTRLDEVVSEHDVAEGSRLRFTTLAMWHDSRGEHDKAMEHAQAAVKVSDRDTLFSDLLATQLESRFILAVQLQRAGKCAAADKQLARCRRRLEELAAKLPENLIGGFMQLPLHHAIATGNLDPPPGALWIG